MPKDILTLLYAALLGGLIGWERQKHEKAAGFRTIILITVGATLFTMFSKDLAGPDEKARIASNIVVGVGFLGAGVILRHEARITGLTTAATIWFAAAVGMGVGGGYLGLSAAATAIALVVLWLPFRPGSPSSLGSKEEEEQE